MPLCRHALNGCRSARWIRPDPWRVYRSLHFSSLADLHLTATRIYRDLPVPGPEMHSPERTALGLPQRQWLVDTVLAPSRQERCDAVAHVKPGSSRLVLSPA